MSEQDGGVAADEGQVTVAGRAKIANIAKITKITKIAKVSFELSERYRFEPRCSVSCLSTEVSN